MGTKADDASERDLRVSLERFREMASGVAPSRHDPNQVAAWATIGVAVATLRGAVRHTRSHWGPSGRGRADF